MPTYEYKREDGTTFEVWQGINDDPLETCPETGQKVRRLISGGGGVVYKGDGFYVTDYKKNKEKQAKSEQATQSDSDSDTTNTSDESSSDNESSSGNSDTTSEQ